MTKEELEDLDRNAVINGYSKGVSGSIPNRAAYAKMMIDEYIKNNW